MINSTGRVQAMSRIAEPIGYIDGLPVYSMFGGTDTYRGGYQTLGDVVNITNDGVDLNALWAEFQATMAIYNESRGRLVQLLTFPVTNIIETVPQVGEASFEMASEFGEPKAARIKLDYYQLGYDFHDYDVASRYTWMFLRDADARQVEAVHQEILRADSRLLFKKILEAIFDNRNRTADIRNQNYNVYPLYNGDGTVPPTYKGTTFTGSHTHYLASGNSSIDSGDLEDAYEHIAEHGYGIENGTQFLWLGNKTEIKEIRKFRLNATNNNSVIANYDFIPAPNQPAVIVPNAEGLLGSLPPSDFRGLRVTGSYADLLIVEEPLIPPGYFVLLASGGAGNLMNLIGFREHANPAYRGLRLLPGNDQRYPLIDGYYARSFGTGVRQRAGAVIMQITANASYAIPEKYKNNGILLDVD
jgi:hypothetical protein